jgi:RHS repeat-associated protein
MISIRSGSLQTVCRNETELHSLSYNLRYPGQYFDAETGLNQNMRRDFDPATGRYIESDPLSLNAGVNTYAYVRGNPLSKIDPYGLWDWPSLPQNVVNASAGLGDALLLGYGNRLRYLLNISGGVDVCSRSYQGGQLAGIAGTFLVGEGEANLAFKTGHYAERLIAEGVDVRNAEGAVASEINAIVDSLAEGAPFSGRVTVDGTLLEYRAYPLPGGPVNVGTIFPVK